MNADGSNVQLVAKQRAVQLSRAGRVTEVSIIFPICKNVDFGHECQIYVAPVPGTSASQQ